MAGQDEPRDHELIDRGIAEFVGWFAQCKRVWELEEMVRDLVPPEASGTPEGDAFADAIITRLERTPTGVSALYVMGKVAMPLVALKARSAVDRLVAAGGPKPSSLARRSGGLAPVQAWRLGDDDKRAFLILCRRPNVKSTQLAMVSTVDVEGRPILVDASLAGPLPDADLADLLSAFRQDGADPVETSLAEVARELVDLATSNITTGHGPTAQALPILSGLFAHMDVPDWAGLVTALSQLPLAEWNEDEPDDWDEDLDALDLGPDDAGIAERLVRQMEVEGVDPTRIGELQSWMADFNARPIEERAEILPDPMPGLPGSQGWSEDAPRPKRRESPTSRKRGRRR